MKTPKASWFQIFLASAVWVVGLLACMATMPFSPR